MTIIVSGHLDMDPADRAAYLDDCLDAVRAARTTDGCLGYHLSADPLEPGRVNIYECWTSVGAVEAFRGSGPSDEQQAAIRSAKVEQHEIASTISLT